MGLREGGTILVLALILTAAGATYGETARSSFAELLARAKQDMGTEQGAAYDDSIGKQFEIKHTSTVSNCVEAAGPAQPEAFRAIIVVEKDGTVSEVALDPETKIAKCIRQALLKETFPEPPVAPFHDLMQLSFK